MTHIALLRGINVGGKCLLPMRELQAIFAAAGAQDVRTYVQSGNVIFRSEDAAACVAEVTEGIAKQFGYPGRIVLRSAGEMRALLADNPFARAGVPEDQLHVYLLADRPADEAIAALDPHRSPGDAYTVQGREIYLALPNGMARTKLTNAWFDMKLKTVSTARNWRTVKKLVEMVAES